MLLILQTLQICVKKRHYFKAVAIDTSYAWQWGDTKTYRAVDYNVFFVLTDMTHIIYSIKHLDIPTKYHAT